MIAKRASVKAIEYCTKLSGKKFKANAGWSELSWIFLEGYEYDVRTGLEATKISLYKMPGEKEDLLETFIVPNEEVYNKKMCDWDWNYIYRMLFEWISKKRKPRAKKTKKSSPESLEKEVNNLKKLIKESSGTQKRQYIKEYNDKYKKLEKLNKLK